MSMKDRVDELAKAVGSSERVREKLHSAWQTLRTTFDRKERRRRMTCLLEQGYIDEIPSEWQITQASYSMMTEFIIPSNGEFYEHYDQNQYWLQFLRVLDEPSTMMDPTGLAVSPEMLIQHLMHVVHTSAGYDVALLHMFPGGIEELVSQLGQYVAGEHPRQESIAELLELPDYPERLLAAVKLYIEDPVSNWKIITYETPDGCEELFEFGIDRFGSLARLLKYALTLPRSPWESLRRAIGFRPALNA